MTVYCKWQIDPSKQEWQVGIYLNSNCEFLNKKHFDSFGKKVLKDNSKTFLESHGGGGPQTCEVTCGGSPHLSCKRDQIKMRDYMDRQVTSPTWGPPPLFKRGPKSGPNLPGAFLQQHLLVSTEQLY